MSPAGIGFGFPRTRRLSKKDFSAVIHSGRALRGLGLAILLKKTNHGTARFGVVVPKRCVALAVNRNRYKRIFREWFRHNSSRLLGRDCVIRVTAPLGNAVKESAIIAEIERLIVANLPAEHS